MSDAAADKTAADRRRRYRGRLFRKYILLFVALVGGTLLANGALELWFSYQENKAALARVQHEKALAAAARIEQFIDEMVRQIGWTTRAQWSRSVLEQRRFEYLQLLRQAPAVTEVSHLDGDGREELRVSRLAMDVIGGGTDFSNEPKFKEAKAHKTWFSPVYFRKESEPYITVALAGTGRDTGVTVAEVNLKFIWDVISRIKVGKAGYAYVVDARGLLIAHPDIGFVLRKSDLSKLPQVAAALAETAGSSAEQAPVGIDSAGHEVLTAHAAIAPLDWTVFVDLPLGEAFAPLYVSMQRTAALILLGLALAVGAGILLARRMVVPIKALQAGATQIGAGDLDHRIAIRTGDELEALADQFNRMAAQLEESYAGLESTVERRTAELREALEQQTATAEVLKVISRSRTDLQPVLDTLVTTAARLCHVDKAFLFRLSGDHYRLQASFGGSPEFMAFISSHPIPQNAEGTIVGRTAMERRPVHYEDVTADPRYTWTESQRIGKMRTALGVPLLRDGQPIGVFAAWREVVEPFTPKQIELITTFADQAVIAIENTRLLDALQARTEELGRSVEELTATSDVLRIIARSPGDLQPVLDKLVETATHLCRGERGFLFRLSDGAYRLSAAFGYAEDELAFMRAQSIEPSEGTLVGRTALRRQPVHFDDVLNDPTYTWKEAQQRFGYRSNVGVPLLRDGEPIGVFAVVRNHVEPFSDRQIELLKTFADQAVIAIENARLLEALQARTGELSRSVEELTATSEVLRVIASSPGQLDPVLRKVADNAAQLCEADDVAIFRVEGEQLRYAACHGTVVQSLVADGVTIPLTSGSVAGRSIVDRRTVHVPDLAALQSEYPDSPALHYAEVRSVRTVLAVPLLREGSAIGTIVIHRAEVRPFSAKQIELVTSFADQAVIAIENARLLDALQARTDELARSLEELTATSDVLRIIASSPGELDPVLQAVARNAARLCEADHVTIHRVEQDQLRFAASFGILARPQGPNWVRVRISRDAVAGRAVIERRTIHVPDITAAKAEYPDSPAHRYRDVRTVLGVPLLREGVAIGAIVALRAQMRPFSERQTELVTSFADQAVIAIENARLLDALQARTDELARSLKELTATSDVLRIIARSPGDLQPVLDTLVETAKQVCAADRAFLFRSDGAVCRLAAYSTGWSTTEFSDHIAKNPITPGTGTAAGRTLLARRPVHILDAWSEPGYQWVEFAKRENLRTLLGVPLLREGVPIGVITVNRNRVQAFTEREIELLTTFADQAVIAIENARLLDALQARTDELARSVEELKALGEVGRAVSSTLDLKAVLETVVARGAALGEAEACMIYRYRAKHRQFRLWHAAGLDPAFATTLRALNVREDETLMGRAVRAQEPVQIADLATVPNMPLRDAALAAGYRAALIVPLVRAERVFGALVLNRRAPGEFPAGTVSLLRTFASQSILAIQNARLFNEIEDKSRQLEIASQHKSQFLANMSHELRTPLNAILGYTELLLDGLYGKLGDKAQGVLERVQTNGKHLLGLINDVLDLAKIEAGQLVLAIGDYSIGAIVQSVVAATESLASAKGLDLRAEVAPALPLGHGDERRLTQVLLNLVGNAIKFTDSGAVTITALVRDGRFKLAVRDTGPGIAAADQARIFEEFHQVDNSSTRKKGGTGLGLAISKRIVELHGGTISVESQLGAGATFRVDLPVRAGDAREVA